MMPRLLCVLSAAWLVACGGSSSETPFPLEPDLERLEGKPATRYIVVNEGEPGEGAPKPKPAEPAEEPPAAPAPATWGAPAKAADPSSVPDVPLQ